MENSRKPGLIGGFVGFLSILLSVSLWSQCRRRWKYHLKQLLSVDVCVQNLTPQDPDLTGDLEVLLYDEMVKFCCTAECHIALLKLICVNGRSSDLWEPGCVLVPGQRSVCRK